MYTSIWHKGIRRIKGDIAPKYHSLEIPQAKLKRWQYSPSSLHLLRDHVFWGKQYSYYWWELEFLHGWEHNRCESISKRDRNQNTNLLWAAQADLNVCSVQSHPAHFTIPETNSIPRSAILTHKLQSIKSWSESLDFGKRTTKLVFYGFMGPLGQGSLPSPERSLSYAI